MHLLWRNYLFTHWKLHLLECDLDDFITEIPDHVVGKIADKGCLKVFEKHFKKYLEANHKFFQEGAEATVLLDEEGNAYAQVWGKAGADYYDSQLYRCTIPVPEDCVYLFAGEVAIEYRRANAGLYALQLHKEHFRSKGYKRARLVVEEQNTHSLGLQYKAGFKKLGVVIHAYRVLRFFSFTRYEKTYR